MSRQPGVDLDAALAAVAEPLAAAVTRRLVPELRKLFAEHTAGCSCTVAPKVRPGAPPRTAYTVAEVAQSLGVSTIHVRRLLRAGAMRHIQTGQRYVIPVTAFKEYLDRATTR